MGARAECFVAYKRHEAGHYRAGDGAGISESKMAAIAFYDPLAAFRTSRYSPLSIAGLSIE